jgi:alpha-L-fucosidase
MGSISLPGLADKVKYMQFLHDASEIRYRAAGGENPGDVIASLPVIQPPVEIPVIEVLLK